MTTLAINAWNWSTKRLQHRIFWVSLLSIVISAFAFYSAEVRLVILTALAEAYIQVSAFVAMTLALFYGLEKGLNIDAGGALERHHRWQVPIAAFLGALPGCGGAIVVVTQYVHGRISFGAVLAVLTATMGDAAFLLLSQAPATGLLIFAMGFGVGTVTGVVVDAIHGPNFLRQSSRGPSRPSGDFSTATGPGKQLKPVWVAMMVPGVVLAFLAAFQVDIDSLLGSFIIAQPSLWFGAAGSILSIAMWALTPAESLSQNIAPANAEDSGQCHSTTGSILDRVAADTNFVTAWVVAAFLIFELTLFAADIDLKSLFDIWAPLMPLIGILLGLLPGCGPQVIVTTLYLNGVIPLSAQLGNAISNDGDALFPAIALAPKVAIVATLYSAVPALIIGYGYWAIFE